jgi:predicted acylesterase/phospholipase RssA
MEMHNKTFLRFKRLNILMGRRNVEIPEKERALVLQGGGSLGAYGAGVYSAFYESLSRIDAEEGNKGRPIFDIIAGTSIGAINAAILVSYVVENQTYEGSAEKLVEFWNYLSKESIAETNPFLNLGGITGMKSTEQLRQGNLLEDTIQLMNLQYSEYQMCFILMDPHMITNFLIHITHGTDLVTNH